MRELRTILGATVLLSLLASQVACFGTTGLDDLYVEGGVLGPQLEVEPMVEVTFAQVPEGAETETEVLLRSAGDVPLALDTVELVGPDAAMFVLPELPLPLMLPVGADMPIRLGFAPEAEGQYQAELVVTTRNAETLTFTRDVLGQACRDWDEDMVCDYGGPPGDSGDTGW